MLSKYSLLKFPPPQDNPAASADRLEDRYQKFRAEWHQPIKTALKALLETVPDVVVPAIPEHLKNRIVQRTANRATSNPTIDNIFCVGIGTFSWEVMSNNKTISRRTGRRMMKYDAEQWPSSTAQLVSLEALYELLTEDFGFTVGEIRIQEPVLSSQDIIFLERRGHIITNAVEADMTDQSLLFAPGLPIAITSGMVADYQPKIYLGLWSPTEVQEQSRDEKKLYDLMQTHEGRSFDFLPDYYELWTRKADRELFTRR